MSPGKFDGIVLASPAVRLLPWAAGDASARPPLAPYRPSDAQRVNLRSREVSLAGDGCAVVSLQTSAARYAIDSGEQNGSFRAHHCNKASPMEFIDGTEEKR